MPKNFVPCDREQQLLMAPDLREWLPPDHLVWFVIDSVAALDLEEFYAGHRDDGWGRAAYEPRMMVTLLLYSYSIGVRSAREMERRSTDDVAFRVITANRKMDHATICRFRTRHRAALSALFAEVLGLCAEADMVRPGLIAIDGTKIAANASHTKNLTQEQLEEFAREVFDEAERIDRAEDELFGDKRGDEIPPHLVDRAARIEWLKERLAAKQQAAHEGARQGSRRKARINQTDPDSDLQRTSDGFVQGFNGQIAVTEDQIIIAADVTADNNDSGQLEPMITLVHSNLTLTTAGEPGTIVADAGYFSDDALKIEGHVLVAPVSTRNLSDAIAERDPVDMDALDVHRRAQVHWKEQLADANERAALRVEVLEAYRDKHLRTPEAADLLGTTIQRLYWLKWHLKKFGWVPPPTMPPGPERMPSRSLMLERFAQPGAAELYAQRARTVEPVFGQLKECRRMRRFVHRGLDACRCEWSMMATGHNLRKLWRKGTSVPRPLPA